jgi:ribosomal protein S18 acetylase RimI-like enzyme
MRVRPASVADIPAIIEVELSAGQLFAGTHMNWAVGDVSDPDELISPIEDGNVWVAEEGGQIAGYLCGEALDGHFHIEEVSVSSAFQRRGVGRMLIEFTAVEGRRRGCLALSLTTDRTLPWNAPYYARIGFRVLGPEEISPSLAREISSKPNADLRCAMRRDL